jgi:hypothetical protein
MSRIDKAEDNYIKIGRVGAINLEQLDTLLLSLKTYWDYSNNKGLLETIRAFEKQPASNDYRLAYEL